MNLCNSDEGDEGEHVCNCLVSVRSRSLRVAAGQSSEGLLEPPRPHGSEPEGRGPGGGKCVGAGVGVCVWACVCVWVWEGRSCVCVVLLVNG